MHDGGLNQRLRLERRSPAWGSCQVVTRNATMGDLQ
jgi:hypothetical protein